MKQETAAELGHIVLLLDGHRGIYLPQDFARHFRNWEGVDSEQRDILDSGPDHVHYWECWDEVLDDATFTDDNGEWALYQDGDLFAFRSDLDIDWE